MSHGDAVVVEFHGDEVRPDSQTREMSAIPHEYPGELQAGEKGRHLTRRATGTASKARDPVGTMQGDFQFLAGEPHAHREFLASDEHSRANARFCRLFGLRDAKAAFISSALSASPRSNPRDPPCRIRR